MNNGKRFEQNFKKSVPKNVFFYRFRDGTANFSGGSNANVRFQQSNICDCMLYDGNTLILCELKSHKGKSLPLSAIRANQLTEMLKSVEFEGMNAYIIVQFTDVGRTFAIRIQNVESFIKTESVKDKPRKSIPIKYFEQEGIEIEAKKKKVNEVYNIKKFIEKVEQNAK